MMALSVDEVQANIWGNFLPIKRFQVHRIRLEHAVSLLALLRILKVKCLKYFKKT